MDNSPLPIFDPEAIIPTLPTTSGVYLMYNREDVVIYVGKAKNLRARVRQYFASTPDPRPFVAMLPSVLREIQTVSTLNEKEALLLERTLILQHRPRYNIALKFSSGHLYLRIDLRTSWPRFTITHHPKKDGARYFGPYLSGGDMRAMLQVIERTFQVRNCNDRDFRNRSRPCLQYQIKRCSAPCTLSVDRDEYLAEIDGATAFLLGKHPELLRTLQEKMTSASHRLEFERAAYYRDQIQAIERSLIPQEVEWISGDQDVIGVYRERDSIQVMILKIRRGTLIKTHPLYFEEQGAHHSEWLTTFLHLYYTREPSIPREVILPFEIEAPLELEECLKTQTKARFSFKVPKRGRLYRLLSMANQNAEQAFFQTHRAAHMREKLLLDLQKLCQLTQLPYRIECFDISIFHGEAPIASQVVFEGALPRKRLYRIRKIKTVSGTDDFAMMREALTRRLQGGLRDGDLPQLIVVDGGKGQLAVAQAVIADLDLHGVNLIGLAKSRVRGSSPQGAVQKSQERVFLPNIQQPISLRSGTPIYRLLTQLRDEAHRTAIQAHRQQRRKTRLTSPLEEISGVGPKRRTALLKAFGSIQGVCDAEQAQLAEVVGISKDLAQTIYDALHEEL